MKVGIVVFPGSNCDYDCYSAVKLLGVQDVSYVWHKEVNPGTFDAYVLPGGFSYGDHLRAGIIAAFTPIMDNVKKLAKKGMPVFGICNGFQILVEAGLLPGALIGNDTLRFSCKWVNLEVESTRSAATYAVKKGDIWKIPIAHGEGRYYLDKNGLKELNDNDQVVWRYVTEEGEKTKEANPNGSVENIAGISNLEGNVVGLMPHPERAAESILSPWKTEHGKYYFESIEKFVRRK